ncbi:DNA translocase FtsK [Vibrio cholerae]
MTYPMLSSDLKALQQTPELQGVTFSISRIQRFMGIGYNRAAHLVDAALEKGILVRDNESEWLVRLVEEKSGAVVSIQSDIEYKQSLAKVESLIGKITLSCAEEFELNQLVDAIQAYETVHYPIPNLSDNVVSAVKWNNPVGDVPGDWIEKWTVIGFYTLRVWFSVSGYFEASLTHNETLVRSRLDIGEQEDLKAACDKAAEVAIETMTGSSKME